MTRFNHATRWRSSHGNVGVGVSVGLGGFARLRGILENSATRIRQCGHESRERLLISVTVTSDARADRAMTASGGSHSREEVPTDSQQCKKRKTPSEFWGSFLHSFLHELGTSLSKPLFSKYTQQESNL